MIIGAIIWKNRQLKSFPFWVTKKSSDFILEDLDVENDNHHANRLIKFYTEPIQPLLEMGTSRKLINVFQNYYSLKRLKATAENYYSLKR